MGESSNLKKAIIFVWGLVENLLFAAIIHGWPSLVYVLKEDGVFSHLCRMEPYQQDQWTHTQSNYSQAQFKHEDTLEENNTHLPATNSRFARCEAQDTVMTLAFTIASAIFEIVAFPIGYVFDRCGLRVSRFAASLFFIVGTLLLAFTSVDQPILVFPGLICVSVASMHITVTNMQIANFFSRRRSTVIGIYQGSHSTSVIVFQAIKLAHQYGLSRKYSMIIFCCAWSLVIFSTFFLLPKGHIRYNIHLEQEISISDQEDSELMIRRRKAEETTNLAKHNLNNNYISISRRRNSDKSLQYSYIGREKETLSLKDCVMSTYFIFHVFWVSALGLRLFTFLGLLAPLLSYLTNGDEITASHYQSVSSYIFLTGCIFSLLVGVIIDMNMRTYIGLTEYAFRPSIATVIPLTVASACAVTMTVTSLIPHLHLQYFTFSILPVFRAFLFSSTYAFVMITFPQKHYGKIVGLTYAMLGVVMLIQQALYQWAAGPPFNPMPVNLFLLTIMVLTFVHPFTIWWRHRTVQLQLPQEKKRSAEEMKCIDRESSL